MAMGTNIGNGLIDVYQLGRAITCKDSENTIINSVKMLLIYLASSFLQDSKKYMAKIGSSVDIFRTINERRVK